MTVSLLDRGVVAPVRAADLRVRREDIEFRSVKHNRVRIGVTVTNHGNVRSRPTVMSLQAAPLGAFVSWQDLTSVNVPSIDPHQSLEVTAEVAAPGPRVLGDFSRVPPRRLLTAIGDRDESASRRTTGDSLATPLWNLLKGKSPQQQTAELPADPLSLLSRPSVHWAGNINVLIGNRAVERHLARALRIHAGRTNLALFFVGDRPDEYQFKLTGSGVGWDAALFDFTDLRSLVKGISPAKAIPLATWLKMRGCRVVLLAVSPPEHCEEGRIEVHVRQRSSDREAIVEFSLDPNAAGAGCYAV